MPISSPLTGAKGERSEERCISEDAPLDRRYYIRSLVGNSPRARTYEPVAGRQLAYFCLG